MKPCSLILLAAFCWRLTRCRWRARDFRPHRSRRNEVGRLSERAAAISPTIEPWRFEGTDAVQGTSWTASTHVVRLFGGRGLFGNQVELPFVANGVVLYLDDANENTEIDVTTAQGNFTVRLRDIPYGKVANALNNRVMVDRIPPFTQLTSSPEEQDYPGAAADKSGNVWLAYMEFKHNKDHNRLRANRPAAGHRFL